MGYTIFDRKLRYSRRRSALNDHHRPTSTGSRPTPNIKAAQCKAAHAKITDQASRTALTELFVAAKREFRNEHRRSSCPSKNRPAASRSIRQTGMVQGHRKERRYGKPHAAT